MSAKTRCKFGPTAVAAAALALFAAVPAAAQVTFTEVAVSAGVDVEYSPSTTFMTEAFEAGVMGHGGAVGDLNNDGWSDLFVPSDGTSPDRIFFNEGGYGTPGRFFEVTDKFGLTETHFGNGAAMGDYNNDGWLDIFVTSWGPGTGPAQTGAHRLYRNNGDGTLDEVAAIAGVNQTSALVRDGFSGAFGDYDLDGDLDLFVTGWIENSGGNRLFRNNGDETFTDVTDAQGLDVLGMRGFTPCFADMDGDIYPELLISADFGTSRYFVNSAGAFSDFTLDSGTGLDGNGMGSAVGDMNRDGTLDWYVSSIYSVPPDPERINAPGTGNMLYLQKGTLQPAGTYRGNNTFDEVSEMVGVKDGGWGWGSVIADIDNDGLMDIVETNGWENSTAQDDYEFEMSKVFHSLGGGNFEEIAAASGFDTDSLGRGLVRVDYDLDGDLDFIVFSSGYTGRGRLQIYRNDTVNANNWLRITLDTSANPNLAPNGVGSMIRVTTSDRIYTSSLGGTSCSYLSQSELAAHFGLGNLGGATEVRLTIRWTDGQVTVTDVPVDRKMRIAAPAPAVVTR